MHLRQAEVTEEKNSGGPSRATAPGSYVRAARLRAELGSFVRLIWISLLLEGVPAGLVSGPGKRECGETGVFQKDCHPVQFSAISKVDRLLIERVYANPG